MQRHETAEERSRPTAVARSAMLRRIRAGLSAIAGMIAVVLVLVGASNGSAEPAHSLDARAAPSALVTSVIVSAETAQQVVDSGDEAAETVALLPRVGLAELLLIRNRGANSRKLQSTDEALAIAVAKGTNPELASANPFRKRSRDLFRSERPVSIGNTEMLLRLRLRARARKAMSVELRF